MRPMYRCKVDRSALRALLCSLVMPVLQPLAAAQAGDVPGEDQPPLPDSLRLPAPPSLTPEEAIASFRLPAGVELELVAAEPLVGDPVAIAFDGEGRLWVAEMRGYMPDVDGTGEAEPVGQIAVLDDTDGDGRMDERTVFLDGLVLPRAILPTRGGLLCIAPPEFFFARDSDGDGVADERVTLATGLGGIESPEHAINSLHAGLDNWIRVANAPRRWRALRGEWIEGRTASGGQWGLCHDDDGRVFYNTNSQSLFADLIPSHYAVRNSNLGRARGVLVRIVKDETVRPARPNPGVNRGYQKGLLREDGTLSRFTAACSPFIHRGTALARFRGDAFVCEPAGNLVKHFELTDDGDGRIVATDPRSAGEFLTSTDERFRPVALANGPDGALYIADMYRGVIQHRVFVTTFLRRQIEERRLERPIGHGRIWRLTDGDARTPVSGLADRTWTEVTELLGNPDGWWRDLAQRTIVEEGEGDRNAIELTLEAARSKNPQARVHALWALEGIDALERGTVEDALGDLDPRVVRTAIRLAENFLARDAQELLALIVAAAEQGSMRTRWQAALSAGEASGEPAHQALLELLASGANDDVLADCVLSGLAGEEIDFLGRLLSKDGWAAEAPGRRAFVARLTRCIGREGRSDRILHSLDLARHCTGERSWQSTAVLRGLLDARAPGPDGSPAPLVLSASPQAFTDLTGADDPEVARLATELRGFLFWPGRDDLDLPTVRPLEPDERARFERGRAVYAQVCSSCHQASGRGEPGKAPALRASRWTLGDAARLVRIVRWGLVGPIEVRGEHWESEMPAWGGSDEDLAAVLTYTRREWGNGVEPVTVEQVRAATDATPARNRPFTIEELESP